MLVEAQAAKKFFLEGFIFDQVTIVVRKTQKKGHKLFQMFYFFNFHANLQHKK